MPEQSRKKLKRITDNAQQREPIRVLYVEDAAVIRDTIVRLLELKGYQVNHAKNGQEGVDLAMSWNPQVILMDLRMPVMDGYRAISEIRNNPHTRHLPIFVISAWSSKKERTQAKLVGANDFFVKPPDLNRLVEAINKAVLT